MPMFDRLGAMHKTSIGYRGTRDLIFEVGNVFIENQHEPAGPSDASVGPRDAGVVPRDAGVGPSDAGVGPIKARVGGCAGNCSHPDAAAVSCH
jgi:hypothetical protein